jgi:hypothetical protein
MFNKNKSKKQYQSTWSLSMLEALKNFSDLPIPEIFFNVKERETSISFDVTTVEESICYLGGVANQGLEDVYFGLSSWWEREDLTEEYQNYMGYIEILNGTSSLMGEHVPMIRGFIKNEFSFFESVNKLLIESKLFNKRITLIITVDMYGIFNIPTEDIFNMICDKKTIKLPIKRVDVSQRISFE